MPITGQSTSQIRVAGTGRLFVAPVGTTAPTDVTTAWGAGWQDLGLTDDSGVTVTKKDSWDSIAAWQMSVPARMVPKSRAFSAKFTLLQLNAVTLPLWAGGGAVTTTGSTYKYSISETLTSYERALGIEWTDNNGAVTNRLIISRGQVSDTSDVNLTRAKAAGLGITFDALGVDGVAPLVDWLSNDPNFTP